MEKEVIALIPKTMPRRDHIKIADFPQRLEYVKQSHIPRFRHSHPSTQ
jgi:hypothetical protein